MCRAKPDTVIANQCAHWCGVCPAGAIRIFQQPRIHSVPWYKLLYGLQQSHQCIFFRKLGRCTGLGPYWRSAA